MAVQRGLNLGVALFIVSEALFFLSVFWAFFHESSLLVKCEERSVAFNSVILIIIGRCLMYSWFYKNLIRRTVDIADSSKFKYKVHFNNNYNNSLTASSISIMGSAQPLLRPFNLTCNGLLLNRNRGFVFERLSLKNFSGSTRYLSTSQEPNIPAEFYEWLAGLTDGEGNFYIRRRTSGPCAYSFKFTIGVHKDDKDMLIFIQKTLGIGKVFSSKNVCSYEVYDIKGTAKIIEIFTKYSSLNTTKLLNFLAYKKAYELYRDWRKTKVDVSEEIDNLKSGMNNQRTNYLMPESYKPLITPNWLLGFIEGEGSFSVIKGFGLTFSLCQSSTDSALMLAIKDYLERIQGAHEHKLSNKDNVVYLGTFLSSANNEITRITISQTGYIRSVLIPFLSQRGLVWRSKKYLDFQDWVNILKLRDRCHHYEEKGNKLMHLIVSQMNNKRLSTAETPRVNRELLQRSINELLKGPSNCEDREGKIWIKSLNRFRHKGGLIKPIAVQLQDPNGDIVETFATQADCANSLGTTRTSVARWLLQGKPVLFKNRIVYITKVEALEEE